MSEAANAGMAGSTNNGITINIRMISRYRNLLAGIGI